MFNEDNTVEQMLIEAATQSSWQYVKSQDIPRSSDSVLVESWLLEALIRLNPGKRRRARQGPTPEQGFRIMVGEMRFGKPGKREPVTFAWL